MRKLPHQALQPGLGHGVPSPHRTLEETEGLQSAGSCPRSQGRLDSYSGLNIPGLSVCWPCAKCFSSITSFILMAT